MGKGIKNKKVQEHQPVPDHTNSVKRDVYAANKAQRVVAKKTVGGKVPPASTAVAKSKAKSFIDDLFASARPSKVQGEPCKSHADDPAAPAEKGPKTSKQGKKSRTGTKDDLFGLEDEARQKTAEGWNIYSESELKLTNAGGDTDLCPFDCNCCH